MTIVTKPKTEKSVQKPLQKPLIINIKDEGGFVDTVGPAQDHTTDPNVEMWLSPSARRRISTTTTVCVFITALLVMSIGIIGGVYLYRQVTQHQTMSRFRGWCGVPYQRNSLNFPRETLQQKHPFFRDEMSMNHHLFKEEFDLDLASEYYEQITVPDFGYGRKGVFVHDFKENKTGIIDITGERCFVMPLDRHHVQPPRRLFDLIHNMWQGYYSVDTRVIRRRMKVVRPPIEDLNTQGTYIARHCAHYTTYLLKERFDRVRRETKGLATDIDKEGKFEELTLAEFAGNNIVEFIVEDSNQ